MVQWLLEIIFRNVTRIEVIDESGRAFTRHDHVIDLASMQDNGRTLKLFIKRK